jgi:hypothetical protein
VVCYFGFTNDLNYLHYSIELLPALLLALGVHGLVVWVQDGPDRSLVSAKFAIPKQASGRFGPLVQIASFINCGSSWSSGIGHSHER